MDFRLRLTSSCSGASPLHHLRVLPLLALLLVALVPMTTGQADDEEPYVELRCRCLNTVSGITLNHISELNIFRPGGHCATMEMIATLKNGEKRCLNPSSPAIRNVIRSILQGQ